MRRRVLIIEDNEPLRSLFEEFLGRRGFDVSVAGTGIQALEIAAQHAIDAVITDLEIPGLSGLELCHALRNQSHRVGRAIPVWLMTGDTAPEIAALAAAAGAAGIFHKPFNLDEACSQVAEMLSGGSLSRSVLRPAQT